MICSPTQLINGVQEGKGKMVVAIKNEMMQATVSGREIPLSHASLSGFAVWGDSSEARSQSESQSD